MQFTSNIIVVLLLVVVSSSSTTTAAQESSNLRGGRQLLEELDENGPRSDFPDDDTPHPGERQLLEEPGDNGPIEDGAIGDSFSDHERSLLDIKKIDGCKGLDSKVDLDTCRASGNPCPTSNICCKSVFNIFWTDYYCY